MGGVAVRVLVVHASQFGATQGIAEYVGEVLRKHGVEAVVAAARDDPGELDTYDAFVIGSAIHAGHWLPPAMEFVRRRRSALAARPVWIFSSGPIGDRAVAAPQPDPKDLGEIRRSIEPREHRIFAGAFDRATADFSDLGLIERTVVKRFLPDGDYRDWADIRAWTEGIAHALGRQVAASGVR
jgi:menaquinone-dependent protoporphyrinogen oxidase